jgi:hypothetical protein
MDGRPLVQTARQPCQPQNNQPYTKPTCCSNAIQQAPCTCTLVQPTGQACLPFHNSRHAYRLPAVHLPQQAPCSLQPYKHPAVPAALPDHTPYTHIHHAPTHKKNYIKCCSHSEHQLTPGWQTPNACTVATHSPKHRPEKVCSEHLNQAVALTWLCTCQNNTNCKANLQRWSQVTTPICTVGAKWCLPSAFSAYPKPTWPLPWAPFDLVNPSASAVPGTLQVTAALP